MPSTTPSIFLKAYRCPDGREIHYAAARLHRDCNSPTADILDVGEGSEGNSPTKIGACWVFFYPAGPSRRVLDAIISRYATKFECDKDVIFLCVNRPGKVTSASVATPNKTEDVSAERNHINTACTDVITLLDYYGISRASLFYMCAGSTFAYSFASQHPERTTGYIVGVASWALRSDPSSSLLTNTCNTNETDNTEFNAIETPQLYSLTHRMAMKGFFGPKRMVSWLAGGIIGSSSTIFSSVPPTWFTKGFKKDLSDEEKRIFDEQYPDAVLGAETFVGIMKWIHNDGHDDEVSEFVNVDSSNLSTSTTHENANSKRDGDARDIAVCLSTQQDLGLIYKTTIPPQKQVLLWHGECDKMINIEGAMYMESMIPNATLTKVSEGTHQGVMFFLPDETMDALNRISRDVHV